MEQSFCAGVRKRSRNSAPWSKSGLPKRQVKHSFQTLIVKFAFMSYGYIPGPPPPALTLPKSWFSRNWKWFVPTLVLGLVLLIAVAVGALLTFVFGLLKSSEPYQHAVAVASSNPAVVRELGTPIVPAWYISGNINVSGSSGDADLAIPLKGSLHRGTVYVVAKKTAGVWAYDKLQVLVDGQESPIKLLPATATPSENEDK
jgi:hypothetical protein